MNEWVKLADKLPDYQTPVLAQFTTGAYAVLVRMAPYDDPSNECPCGNVCGFDNSCLVHWEYDCSAALTDGAEPYQWCGYIEHVTRWMPLPQSPETSA
ncbi:hypothetical protein FACS1894184_21450 [Clostridia bacterium]|nr:hypothetical protein FACS1894184_21450 [Clostridia bacterium]